VSDTHLSDTNAKAPLEHGGDLGAARNLFPGAPEPFVDLSTGINPFAYPLPQLPSDIFAGLPEQAALDQLVRERDGHAKREADLARSAPGVSRPSFDLPGTASRLITVAMARCEVTE